MATLSRSETRRLYSWWWDSHNSPKNSKWLQDNLTDMDAKVKSMIKLIEEDADSFARRAEMYYKKRPELLKLVEEFYRAYRALAERYNYATGELRHAHRTIAKAFPDQVPLELIEELPSKPQERDPHTQETKFPVRRALFDSFDLLDGEKNGLRDEREKEETICDEVLEFSNENQLLMEKVGEERERAGKAESEVEGLKKVLSDLQVEKESVLLKYQQCLEKLSDMEGGLNSAQKVLMKFNEKASRAEIEIQTLKEALYQLEAEKNAGILKHNEYLEKISKLEAMVSRIQEDNKGHEMRAIEAESESKSLKDEVSRLEAEKGALFQQYKQRLERISALESLISVNENEASLLKKEAKRAENEVSELRKSLLDLKREKEASAIQYKCCLETISNLERDIAGAKEEAKRLNNDVLMGNLKLKTAEDKCTVLEMSNLSLKTEATNLAKKIAAKDLELSRKQEELEKLQRCLQDEQSLHAQTEATLQSLQNLHSRSQDDQKGLALELKNILCVLNNLEVSKRLLEEEILEVREENQNLSERNLSSSSSMENMQNEIVTLREVKERLEREVKYQIEQSSSLQKEILSLKEEIEGMNRSYRALVEQVEVAGLNPKCVGTSLKILKDENLKLREINEEGTNERETLSKKLENVQELLSKKVVLESSLLDLNNELESSREKVKSLQESCHFLQGEKAMIVSEKASLLLQLKAVTDNMHKMLEKNAVLENTLTMAKVEVEGLREKSKGLEEICKFLKNEQSCILMERSNLALKLENVEKKLESLERRYVGLEEKYAGLEKEKEAVHSIVEELKFSLSFEKQERANSQVQSETRLSGLENQIRFLKEESSWKKKELEEEVERSLNAQFEISVLQKFIKDMEEKNYSLIIECQKHVEASKLAEKLISELENESLEQQVEAELLLDEIERLRLGMHEVFKALEVGSECSYKDKIDNKRTFLNRILEVIEDMKCSISKREDDKEILLVENLVLHTLLEQLEAKGMEIESQKVNLEKELTDMAERLAVLKNEKDKLVELNGKLKSDVSESHHDAGILEAELESLCIKQNYLQESYSAMEEAYLQVNKDNKSLLKKFMILKEEKLEVDKVNDAALFEYVATDNRSLILRRFTEEKVTEIKLLLKDLKRQHEINSSLENEMSVLAKKLELQKGENLVLKDAACKLEREIKGMREYNVQMKKDIVSGNESLLGTEEKLLAAQMKLEAAEKSNLKLCRMVDELKMDVQESKQTKEKLEHNILELSEINSIQKNEIESLYIIKRNFESEISHTRDEIEEMWEVEATSFYFDLQIALIHDVFLKNKVHELTGDCHMLENENASKNSEIEQMKGKICSMESEICGLKSQLYAYPPIVDALRDDLIYLEQNALLWTKLSQNQEPEFLEASAGTHVEDQSLVSLQNLQVRVKAVGKMMEEMNKPLLIRRSRSKSKHEPSTGDTKQPKSRSCLGRKKGHVNDEVSETPKLQKIKTKASEGRNGVLMKDIPLDRVSNSSLKKGIRKKGSGGGDDQMLELWETVGDGSRDLTIGESLRILHRMTDKDIVYDGFVNVKNTPSTDSDVERELGVDRWEVARISTEINKEVKGKRVLERLTSDAQKLEDLQVTVQNLRSKLETNDKGKKALKNIDFETVQEQLIEAEETVMDLVDLNGRLMRSIESCPSPDEKASMQIKEAMKTRRRKVIEQARKGSERIGRLQLELQKIQYVLLKSEEEKKSRLSNRFLKNKTIVLRDLIYNGRKNSARRKKGPLCGCFQPSSSRSGRSSP